MSPSLSAAVWVLDVLRFRLKLNLRLRALPSDWVLALLSTELPVSIFASSSLGVFFCFCERGPVNFDVLVSVVDSTGWDISRRNGPKSPLVFGKDDEMNGEMAARLAGVEYRSIGVGACVLVVLGALYARGSGRAV